MEDVSEFIKNHYNLLHKATAMTKTVQDRKELHNNARKAKRDTLAIRRRNIDVLNLISTPTPTISGVDVPQNIPKLENVPDESVKPKAPAKTTQGGVSKRLELLKKWKIEKAKKKADDKAIAKPIFKVCHVRSDLMAELENVNKVIKGNPIVPGSANNFKFAPPNHKFRPPKGIKPLNFNTHTQSPTAVVVSTRKLRSTPQTKSRSSPVVKNTAPEQSKGFNALSCVLPITNVKENNPQPINTKEIDKPSTSKFNRDGLSEKTKKKPTITADKIKINKKVGTNFENKEAGTSKTGLKNTKTEPTVCATRNTRLEVKGEMGTQVKISKQPLNKDANWEISDYKRSSDGDSNGHITCKKSPKKLKALLDTNERDLNEKSTKNVLSNPNAQNEAEISNCYEGQSATQPKNIDEISKPSTSKLIKDKYRLSEEVKKTSVVTLNKKKINKSAKTNLENKIAGTSHTVLQKAALDPSVGVTRNTRQAVGKKGTTAKVPEQKTPSKTAGREKSDQNKRPNKNDSTSNITCRTISGKSKALSETNESDLKTDNKNDPVNTDIQKDTDEDSPKNTLCELNAGPENNANSSEQQSPTKEHRTASSSSSLSTDYSVDYNNYSTAAQSSGSPIDYKSSEPLYVSPFVTISRGKDSARKEYKIRRSQGKCDFKVTPLVQKILTAHTSPKAGAAYFEKKLDTEIERITGMCNDWETYLKHPDLPEEAYSSIDVAVGQSKLLLSKKFQQFRGLIDQCQTENYEVKPVTCEDLHGYWDMLYLQVENVDKRFENLHKLKQNNWEEILPQKVVPVKRSRGRPKKVQVKSKLMQMIEDAKKKAKDQTKLVIPNIINVDCEGSLQTPPRQQLLEESNSRSRRSLRMSVLKASTSRCSSSPGLTMMKISQSIKQGDGLTPSKSILKCNVLKSTGKKSVVFKEDLKTSPRRLSKTNLFHEEEKENLSDDVFSPVPLTPRRSRRLSKLNN